MGSNVSQTKFCSSNCFLCFWGFFFHAEVIYQSLLVHSVMNSYLLEPSFSISSLGFNFILHLRSSLQTVAFGILLHIFFFMVISILQKFYQIYHMADSQISTFSSDSLPKNQNFILDYLWILIGMSISTCPKSNLLCI